MGQRDATPLTIQLLADKLGKFRLELSVRHASLHLGGVISVHRGLVGSVTSRVLIVTLDLRAAIPCRANTNGTVRVLALEGRKQFAEHLLNSL